MTKPKVTSVSTKSKGICKSKTKSKVTRSSPSKSLSDPSCKYFPFMSKENRTWYESHINNIFMQERILAKEEGDLLGIRTAFRKLGWEPILDVEPKFSKEKVCTFYANITNKKDKSQVSFKTVVDGVQILVNSELLSNLLQIPNEGNLFL
ncbi:hypothetical protein LIER_25409 [Lithospermum erythrorhizon]|uniref:Uncharacterized protein n=1 Tax=Lithospermum erythrorhizon TaxID=34254 RepID=A0AAV3R7V8_LITER